MRDKFFLNIIIIIIIIIYHKRQNSAQCTKNQTCYSAGCEISQPAKIRKVAKFSTSKPEKINTKKKLRKIAEK